LLRTGQLWLTVRITALRTRMRARMPCSARVQRAVPRRHGHERRSLDRRRGPRTRAKQGRNVDRTAAESPTVQHAGQSVNPVFKLLVRVLVVDGLVCNDRFRLRVWSDVGPNWYVEFGGFRSGNMVPSYTYRATIGPRTDPRNRGLALRYRGWRRFRQASRRFSLEGGIWGPWPGYGPCHKVAMTLRA